MDVILLEKVNKLGALGDRVKVRSGYGRNFLIPNGKAVIATAENQKRFEERRAELERTSTARLADAIARKVALEALLDLTIRHRAGNEGKLFGSVGSHDIAEACAAAGVAIDRNEVRLPTGGLRMVAAYEVLVHLHPEIEATLKVVVAAQ